MKIKLNDTTHIDLAKLIETRLLIQANSGGGKSYAIRRLIEQSFGKVQIIVLDPEGEFTNLRTKFDFVYAGKGGDAPVESRSAALLAHRLLELKASAIIDLYELPPQERRHFVRLFCEAMVNAPKELWHDVLVIIDEAHVFAPEKGESEALGPVIDLATRGRKRGYCAVLATQRLPKLNKDAAAECNNKLIGRASQDIDRKRASEELGFTTKEQILSLRDLEPGEFYIFGPAISREVTKIKIGNVDVKPPPRGTKRALRTPPPSAAVKKILAELKDLPQEAAKEARTIAELKAEVMEVRRHRCAKGVDESMVKSAVKNAIQRRERELSVAFGKKVRSLQDIIEGIFVLAKKGHEYKIDFEIPKEVAQPIIGIDTSQSKEKTVVVNARVDSDGVSIESVTDFTSPGKGEMSVLAAIAQHPQGMTREHITVVTGYKTSTRNAYIQRLQNKGYVSIEGNLILPTAMGVGVLGSDYKPLPTGPELIQHYVRTLPAGEAKVFRTIVDAYTEGLEGLTRDMISERTEFKTSTRNAYIQRLGTRKLILDMNGIIRISPNLL